MSKKVTYKENGIEQEIDFNDLKNIENIEIVDVDDDEDFDEGTIRGKITGITPFVCLIVFFVLGFYKNLWHPGWMVFLLIPIVPMFLKIFSKKKVSVVGFLTMLIVIAYVVLGFLFNWWHPGWIIFLLIPIVGILFGGKDD